MAGRGAADRERMAGTDHASLEALLRDLEDEERAVSAARRRVHDQLAVFGGGPELAARERELSAERRRLHERIDALRAQLAEARAAR